MTPRPAGCSPTAAICDSRRSARSRGSPATATARSSRAWASPRAISTATDCSTWSSPTSTSDPRSPSAPRGRRAASTATRRAGSGSRPRRVGSSASGSLLVDFDGDGRVDLLQTNGHVLDRERLGTPFAMPPDLAEEHRDPARRMPSATAGPWFRQPALGRGLAVADLDGDGRPDVVAAALDAPAAVLRNASEEAIIWVSSWSIAPAGPRSARRSASRPAGGSSPARSPQVAVICPPASRGPGSGWDGPRRSAASRWTGPGDRRRSGSIRPFLPRGGLRLRQGTGRTIR